MKPAIVNFPLKRNEFSTISGEAFFETTIKRSTFVGTVYPTSNRSEVDSFFKLICSKHPKANHHCWAFRLFGPPETEYATDAGEPAGSAGRPILGAIKHFNVFDVTVIVTRYYGGIKLGVRGLISAYGETAANAIQSAQLIIREPMTRLFFIVSYDIYDYLVTLFQRFDASMNDYAPTFAENISGNVLLPIRGMLEIEMRLKELKSKAAYLEFFFK